MNKKEQLMEVFLDAEVYGSDYIAVAIKTEGNPEIEIVVNPCENFKMKMKYYDNAYDDDLILKTFRGISIVSACGFDNDVEWVAVEQELKALWTHWEE